MGFSNARVNIKTLAEELGVSFNDVNAAVKKAYVGGFARIFGVENKGNYSTANIATSKKPKGKDNWVTDFQDGFVSLVGHAHEVMQNVDVPQKGLPVRIINCEVTTDRSNKDNKIYKNCAIYDLELMDSNGGNSYGGGQKSGYSKAPAKTAVKKSAPVVEEDLDEDSLPF